MCLACVLNLMARASPQCEAPQRPLWLDVGWEHTPTTTPPAPHMAALHTGHTRAS